jgi:hypothetical protein
MHMLKQAKKIKWQDNKRELRTFWLRAHRQNKKEIHEEYKSKGNSKRNNKRENKRSRIVFRLS